MAKTIPFHQKTNLKGTPSTKAFLPNFEPMCLGSQKCDVAKKRNVPKIYFVYGF